MNASDLTPQSRLVLASASPRRQMLLREAGYEFTIAPADIDEEAVAPGFPAVEMAIQIAHAKARVIVEKFPNDLILAADTVVALDERILGKPADVTDARRMLGLLAGSTHLVISGVVIMRLNPPLLESECVVSSVHMKKMTTPQIEKYLSTGDWRGKAGGYGIQDADPFVTRVSGCETNIVGLPMTTTRVMLERAGVFPRK